MQPDNVWAPATPAEVARLFAGTRWWPAGEIRPPAVHDIWCRPTPGPWRIQVMLDESAGDNWVSRRNPGTHRPIATLGHVSASGIPYLAPEIQLFYKAKRARPKDEQDFAEVLPILDAGQRDWLRAAVNSTYGDHPWLRQLVTNPTAPPR